MEGVIFSALLSSIRLTNKDPRDNERSIPYHREVYEAIAARNGEKAERVMEDLLKDASRRLGGRTTEVCDQMGGMKVAVPADNKNCSRS